MLALFTELVSNQHCYLINVSGSCVSGSCVLVMQCMQMEDDNLQQVLQLVISHTTNTCLLIKCSSLNIRTRLFTQFCIKRRVAKLLPAAVKDVYSQQLSKKRPQLVLKKVTAAVRTRVDRAEGCLFKSTYGSCSMLHGLAPCHFHPSQILLSIGPALTVFGFQATVPQPCSQKIAPSAVVLLLPVCCCRPAGQ